MSERRLLTHTFDSFTLDSGVVLRDVRQAYHLEGAFDDERANVVLVFHALTGSADAAGDWWRGQIGPGRALDTKRYAVLCPNLLGSCCGTTGPVDREDFPTITTRDMARFVDALLDALSVTHVALAVGASLGGMVALQWLATTTRSFGSAVVIAAPEKQSAQAAAWNHVQRELLEHGARGFELARMVGMLTYRSELSLGSRFDNAGVQSWLEHHGARLRARFDARSYRTLIDAMDSHDMGDALHALGARTHLTAVGIPGDQLYSAQLVERWAHAAGGDYREIVSPHGHDAFLIEHEQVSAILGKSLAATEADAGAPA